MRRTIAIAVTAVALPAAAAATLAVAQDRAQNTYEISAKVSPSAGGSKSKPVPVGATYSVQVGEQNGNRPATWKTINTAWAGLRQNGDLFPKCTADQIATVQSDEGCPKGSLVATGVLVGVIGPDNDLKAAGAKCTKDIHVYNSGKGKETLLLVGPGSACGGVGYNPPAPLRWVSGGLEGGQEIRFPIPDYIAHPLPGVTGSVVDTTITYKKLTRKVGGKTRGYLESAGCKGKRKYRVTIVEDPAKTFKDDGTMAKC